MIKRKSVAENVLTVLMPFAAFALLVLSNFVQLGFVRPDESWYLQLIISVVAMVCFWAPARMYSAQNAMDSERIKGLEEQYKQQVALVYDRAEIADLRAWCGKKYDAKVADYIAKRLKLCDITEEVYNEKYRNRNRAIIEDKTLSLTQKKLLKAANNFRKIKPPTVAAVLPNLEKENDFVMIEDSFDVKVRYLTMRKLLFCVLLGSAVAMICPTINTEMPPLNIVMSLMIRLLSGMANFAIGLFNGKTVINTNYANDISAKTLFLEEFHASDALCVHREE